MSERLSRKFAERYLSAAAAALPTEQFTSVAQSPELNIPEGKGIELKGKIGPTIINHPGGGSAASR
jgi:hypothetical protein